MNIQMRLRRFIFALVFWEISYHLIPAVSCYWWIETPIYLGPEKPHPCSRVIRTDFIFSLSVTSRERLPWAVHAFAGRRRGGGKASNPSTLIVPSQREELLRVAQDGSFALPLPQHQAYDKGRAEALSNGAQSISFLHTAVTATVWKSKDFLEVGWSCKEGKWGLIQDIWHALAHLLYCCRVLHQPRSARNEQWGGSGLIKVLEAARVVRITEAGRNSCNITAAFSADLEVGTGFSGEAVSGSQEEVWEGLHSLFIIWWLLLTLLPAPRTAFDPNVIS